MELLAVAEGIKGTGKSWGIGIKVGFLLLRDAFPVLSLSGGKKHLLFPLFADGWLLTLKALFGKIKGFSVLQLLVRVLGSRSRPLNLSVASCQDFLGLELRSEGDLGRLNSK